IADGVSVEISAMSAPSIGTVMLLSVGSIQYTSSKRFKNQHSSTYTITSGNVTSTAMVTVAPQSSPDSGGSSPGKSKNK
ncbi:Ig-like domain-containing protein, partial [Aeromonas hydrophila]|uniref:Ig-like domain-containing protein n=1 Tax=Aeromonas hydrophila TaxID=644 RepID=UPI00207D18A7